MGDPTSVHRKRRSPKRYTGYMALMIDLIEKNPSSFEETISQLMWVNSMVEEYEYVMKNSVWEVVPRKEGKLVVGSRWIYKVKHVANVSSRSIRSDLFPKDFLRERELTMRNIFSCGKVFLHLINSCIGCVEGVENPPDGYEDHLFQCCF